MGTATLEAPPVMYRFKLTGGRHIEGKGENAKAYQVTKDLITNRDIYPIIESPHNLAKLFNCEGFPPKFEPLDAPSEPIYVDPLIRQPGESVQSFLGRLEELTKTAKNQLDEHMKMLNALSKEDLEGYAEENDIDLKGAKTPEAMKMAIKAALKVK